MQQFKNWTLIIVGALLADWGIEGFLTPNQFVDGGVTGLSMLLANSIGLPLAFWIVLVNLPFMILGYRHIGKSFAMKTAGAIGLMSLALLIIRFPVITDDKLLAAVFGGIFVGAGVGMAMRGGGVTDGTEILAVILSKRTAATVGEVILVLNVALFIFAGLFVGIEAALYSVLTYFAAFKTIDFLLHGIEAYNGVMIVSDQPDAVRNIVLQELGRGVTVLKGQGGYTSSEKTVLYCVVTRLELPRMQSLIVQSDANAFMVVSPIHDITGGVVKKRPLFV